MGKKLEVAKMIKEQREGLGITMSQLSEKSGVCLSHIARVEKGERFPSALVLRRLAKPLHLSEGQLLATAEYLTNPIGAFNISDLRPRSPQEVLAELQAIQPVAIPIYDQEVLAKEGMEGMEAIEFAYWAPRRAADRNIRGLRVNGECLAPRIEDGDIVFFDTDIEPEDGNIVVVQMDNQLLVKRYRKLKERTLLEDNHGLVEENEAMIRGVVLAVEKWIRCENP